MWLNFNQTTQYVPIFMWLNFNQTTQYVPIFMWLNFNQTTQYVPIFMWLNFNQTTQYVPIFTNVYSLRFNIDKCNPVRSNIDLMYTAVRFNIYVA